MAQTGFTPILTYASNTATSVPAAGNLTNSTNGSELAVNTADKRLFTKDSGGNVVEVGTNPSALTVAGTTTLSALTASTALALNSSKQVVSVTNTGTGNNVLSASPTLTGTIGAAALTLSSDLTLSGGTANGVTYLNASKVLTSGSALTFDGTNLAVGSSPSATYRVFVGTGLTGGAFQADNGVNSGFVVRFASNLTLFGNDFAQPLAFLINNSEQMRLTSTGLGIGTSSPTQKLEVAGSVLLNPTNPALAFNTLAYQVYKQGTSLRLYANSIDHLVCDGTGNVGIGTSSPGAKLDVQTSGGTSALFTNGTTNQWAVKIIQSGSTELQLSPAITGNSGPSIRSVTSGGAAYAPLTLDGSTITLKYSGTTGVLLDSSGNLGLGVTPSAWGASKFAMQIGARASLYGASNLTVLGNNYYDNGTNNIYIATAAASDYYQSAGSHVWRTAASGTAGNAISFTQAMTLDASGNLLVGTTSGTGYKLRVYEGGANLNASIFTNQTATYATQEIWNQATSGDNVFSKFYTEGSATARGSIDYNRAGGLTRYNTTSDYRAKDIIGPLQNVGATIDALKVYEGVMKGATQSRPMLIAHEAQAHAPYAVSGVKDEVNEDGTPKFQQMDVSSLVPLLLAEIQSLRARVAALES